jgi:hypothetical protein
VENQETVEAPKAKRGKGRAVLVGVLVLLGVLALDSAIMMWRDNAAQAQAAAPSDGCSMTGMQGGGSMAAPALDANATVPSGGCPMAAKMDGSGKSQASGADAPDMSGGCPMTKKSDGAAGDEACGGSCPMDKQPTAKPDAAAGKAAAQAPKQAATAVQAGAAVYTCSMCPDVKSDKPGKCPHCGMALTKKAK